MAWTKPAIPEDEQPGVQDENHDFWIENITAGYPGKTFMDGKLLHGVQVVDTHTDASSITTITIRFVVRTLNKGERPPG